MSLINKMLQDLESRQGAPSHGGEAYRGLRPVASARGRPRAWALAGVLVAAALSAFYVTAALRPTGTGQTAAMPFSGEAAGYAAAATNDVAEASAQSAADASMPEQAAIRSPVADPSVPTVAPVPTADVAQTEPVEAKRTEITIASIAREPTPAPQSNEPRPPESPAARRKPTAISSAPPAEQGLLDKKVRPLTAKETAEDHYRRAARLLEQGRGDAARSELVSALAIDAAHHAARELLAGLELQRGRWEDAGKILETGLQVSPGHYPFAQLLARVRMERGDQERALAVLEAAAPHGARDPDFLGFLAALYQRAGRNADAVKTYRRAVALRADDARAWLGLAISLEAEGEPGAAADAYRRARAAGGLAPALDGYATQRLTALKAR
ncbi:MSHA biogenesis protein MshN [Sulfurifustis variabilis]|uniref:MSHA biogenesis protein MshN n=1 Tax=Sulfurifustis variabilis TaxID=1675686 RepID=A0A1B4V3F2_9GAMM|nr:tetratricopeptide repeat protein [Sulfurifustis variabilis]BAU47022.1 MSHA biogenesis protein MshN [Sulfurifustis variabilis]